jgi:hypothetical protein
MQKLQILLALLLAFLVCVNPVHAWDSTGHSVVARIAWKNMNDSTKRSVINALKTAPAESRIREIMPANINAWPPNVNNPLYEQLFQFIGTWPDFIRPDRRNPKPTDIFHHGNWHFRDTFWNAGNNSNSSMAPEGELIDKLREFSQAGSNENPGVQVAWIVHLVGDIHQPLRCSGRITNDPVERDGDKGGNEFCLQPGCRDPDSRALNLHWFWDSTLSRNFARTQGESETAYIKRLADDISRRHPESEFSSSANNLNFEVWSAEGLEKAKRDVYPASLRRDRDPGTTYARNTMRISESSIALAGYRLARYFKNKFGS